ncbi:CotH kinase family protein [Marinimicrobium alkaliphilum]|uniref:CotH kinase family protein n=1 Tax=Marinimicrobium alkaliphilum TaxID=2202654 RepID=UPI000DBA0F63|nr:CotH kinase family protein [Marinimicrobium alkaliphilum]
MMRFWLGLALLLWSFSSVAQVVINELQASNGVTVEDEDGDNEDWIELYNGGSEAVNLDGYWLSDDYDNPSRWIFPAVTLEAGDTLLVWASGKNRRSAGAPLHTNFGISAGGEEILLSAPDGTLIDEVPPLPLPTDISWGRVSDGADEWAYFDEPTPGQSNTTASYEEILDPPTFSAPGGFYDGEFSLTLSHADPEVTIVYTLDGSPPTPNNLDGTTYSYKTRYRQGPSQSDGELVERSFTSYSYNEPLPIADRSDAPNELALIPSTFDNNPNYLPEHPIAKGQVIRARAFKDGAIPSTVASHSYFITDGGENPHQVSVISLAVQEDGLFEYQDGIYVAGSRFDQWRDANPHAWADGGTQANWQLRGREWELPTHLELFEPGSTQADLLRDIGIRVHGGWSREGRSKSLRLYARNAYGESRFNYPIFPGSSDEDYNRLMLRNSGNDRSYTLFRDAMIQALGEGMRMDTQAYRPAVVYLNGEYWGILNLRERYDRHYLARTHGVDPDNVDFLTNRDEVGEGDAVHYQETLDYIEAHGVVEDQHFAHVQTRVDTDNYMDYTIANIFANNTDWPGNNVDYWRLRTDSYLPGAAHGHDGRWRWLWFDADFGFGLYDGVNGASNNTLAFATQAGLSEWPNPDWSTFLLRNLLENEGYREDYINRFADLLNSQFSSAHVVPTIRAMQAVIEPEVAQHSERWREPADIQSWRSLVQIMVDFAQVRPEYQRQHLESHFGLAGRYTLTLDSANAAHGHIRVNTLEVTDATPGVSDAVYPWEGEYFRGVPIRLEAVPAPGYRFSHWSGASDADEARITLDPSGDTQVQAHFVPANPPFLHAWVFDGDLANNTPLETINASLSHTEKPARIVFHSALEGYPFDEADERWRDASMERRNAPTTINYMLDTPYADANLRGLQVKQPFMGDAGENALAFELPTTGYSGAVLRFAAMDEGAADSLLVDYSVSSGEPRWTTAGLSNTILPLADDFQLYRVNFKGVPGVDDNPDFRVRIRFAGPDMNANDGNRVTFNNISLALEQQTELVYFWLFDSDLPNNTELEDIRPTFGAVPGARIHYASALPGYPDTDRQASLERRNEPTALNYWPEGNQGIDFEQVNMRAIQVRQPFRGEAGENALMFQMPTVGIRQPVFRFAAMDEGAASELRVDYAVNAGTPQWTSAGLSHRRLPLVEDSFQAYEVDFSGIAGASDNPHFIVRLRFAGEDMAADNGDRVTFNNISLHGRLSAATDTGDLPPASGDQPPAGPGEFAGRQRVSGATGSVLGDNHDAGRESGEPVHGAHLNVEGAEHSLWWTWTAPDTERMRFVSDLSRIDTVLGVYRGEQLEALTPVVAAQDAPDQLWFVAEAGETYHLAVAGRDNAQGEVALSWNAQPADAAPVSVDGESGQPAIICELAECELDADGNLLLDLEGLGLLVLLLESDNPHFHALEYHGDSPWYNHFSSPLADSRTRIIADVDGLPVVITRAVGEAGRHYQIEAYADGRTRQRVVSAQGSELLRANLALSDSEVELDDDGELRTWVALPEGEAGPLRAYWRLNDDASLQLRYERHNSVSDTWEPVSERLAASHLPSGTLLVLDEVDGEIQLRVRARVANDLYF